jgi:hypothetical protein
MPCFQRWKALILGKKETPVPPFTPPKDGETQARSPAPEGLGAALSDHLSPRFTLQDLTVTSAKLPNFPDAAALANLKKLAALLELLYSRIGPFKIISAYRSPEVQAWIKSGGSGAVSAQMAATTSLHSTGEAADIQPTSMPLEEFYVKLFANPAIREKCGQIVNKKEGGQNTIHLSIPNPKFPTGTPMRVGEDGQYYRLTADEIQGWIKRYPGAVAGAGFLALVLAGVTFYLIRRFRRV